MPVRALVPIGAIVPWSLASVLAVVDLPHFMES
jgi:hypothetical protein